MRDERAGPPTDQDPSDPEPAPHVPDFRSIRRRFEAKSASFSPSWVDGGAGRMPWPALAQRDFARMAGPLGDHSLVSIALAWIRRNVRQGRIVAGGEAGGEYAESKGHPLTGLLRRPNPFDTWDATLGGTSDSLKVDGNAYWVKARDFFGRGQVREVWWVPNHLVDVEPELDDARARQSGPIRGYWVSETGRRRWYEPSDVLHFRDGRDPFRRYMGLSDLKRQARNAVGISAAERYLGAVLINAHAGKVVAPKSGDAMVDSPDDVALLAVARQIEGGTSGENAGRITRSTIAVDVIDTGMGPESMMLDRIVDRPEAYILASLGVNAMTLGLPSSKDMASYANKAEARREAWENGVMPLQDLIAGEVEQQLLPDFPEPAADSVWWDRKDVAALREDANERATRAVALRGAGLAGFNEARAMVDLKPVPGGNVNPIEEAEAAAAAEAERAEAEAERAAARADADPADPGEEERP